MSWIRYVLLVCCGLSCGNTSDKNELDYISITFDNPSVLRIVQTTSSDMIRWSRNPSKFGLHELQIRNHDSMKIFKNFITTAIIDSTYRITTASHPTVIEFDELAGGFEYYDDKNDIAANAMIVYHYNDFARNDTVYISYVNQIARINDYKGVVNKALWSYITKYLYEEFRTHQPN